MVVLRPKISIWLRTIYFFNFLITGGRSRPEAHVTTRASARTADVFVPLQQPGLSPTLSERQFRLRWVDTYFVPAVRIANLRVVRSKMVQETHHTSTGATSVALHISVYDWKYLFLPERRWRFQHIMTSGNKIKHFPNLILTKHRHVAWYSPPQQTQAPFGMRASHHLFQFRRRAR